MTATLKMHAQLGAAFLEANLFMFGGPSGTQEPPIWRAPYFDTCPFSPLFWGRVPLLKYFLQKQVGTLILTSLLEDLVEQQTSC